MHDPQLVLSAGTASTVTLCECLTECLLSGQHNRYAWLATNQ